MIIWTKDGQIIDHVDGLWWICVSLGHNELSKLKNQDPTYDNLSTLRWWLGAVNKAFPEPDFIQIYVAV